MEKVEEFLTGRGKQQAMLLFMNRVFRFKTANKESTFTDLTNFKSLCFVKILWIKTIIYS